MKKYYKTLGLKEGVSKLEIKKAFNKLSKELDPKKNDNQDFFIEETKKLKEAYDKLHSKGEIQSCSSDEGNFSEGALEETKATEDADFCEDSTD